MVQRSNMIRDLDNIRIQCTGHARFLLSEELRQRRARAFDLRRKYRFFTHIRVEENM